MKNLCLALLLPMLACAYARAEEADAPSEKEAGITDEQIAERQKALDERWAKASKEIEEGFAERVKRMSAMKDERLAFEKEMVSRQKDFLGGLKGMKPEERKGAFRKFRGEQKERRQAFRGKHREEREEFRDERHKTRREHRSERREGRKKEG